MFFGDDDDNSDSSSSGSDSSNDSSDSTNDNSTDDSSAATQSAGDAGSDPSGDFTVTSSVETARGSAEQPDNSPQIDLTVRDFTDNSASTIQGGSDTSSGAPSNQTDQSSTDSDFEVNSGAEPSTAHVAPDLDSSPPSPETTMRAADERDGSGDSDRPEEQHDEERNITLEKQESDAEAQQEEVPEAP